MILLGWSREKGLPMSIQTYCACICISLVAGSFDFLQPGKMHLLQYWFVRCILVFRDIYNKTGADENNNILILVLLPPGPGLGSGATHGPGMGAGDTPWFGYRDRSTFFSGLGEQEADDTPGPGLGVGVPPEQDTVRAVCLLRSRSRTFLWSV